MTKTKEYYCPKCQLNEGVSFKLEQFMSKDYETLGISKALFDGYKSSNAEAYERAFNGGGFESLPLDIQAGIIGDMKKIWGELLKKDETTAKKDETLEDLFFRLLSEENQEYLMRITPIIMMTQALPDLWPIWVKIQEQGLEDLKNDPAN